MKYLIIFLLTLTFMDPDPEYPGCTNGVGHTKFKVLYTVSDTTGLTYSFDTAYQERYVESTRYMDIVEYLVTPAGMDTIYWVCPRCDSLQVEISSEKNHIIRIMSEIK